MNETQTKITESESEKFGYNQRIFLKNVENIRANANVIIDTMRTGEKWKVVEAILTGETDVNKIADATGRTMQELVNTDIPYLSRKISMALIQKQAQAQTQLEPQAQAQPMPQAQAQPMPQAQAQPMPQAQAKRQMDLSFLIPRNVPYFPIKILNGKTDNISYLKKLFEAKKKGLMREKFSVLLKGEAGTGKTTSAEKLAEELEQPMVIINMNGNSNVDEFIGQIVPNKNGGFEWQDGWLPTLMRYGGILVIDEINMANADILAILQSVLDKRQNLTLTQNNGEVISSHENFFVVATMNPTTYEGTKELNLALSRRFTKITYEIDDRIFTKLKIDKDIITLAKSLRKNKQNSITLSIREMIAYTDNVSIFGKEIARECFINEFDDDETMARAITEAFELMDSGKDLNVDDSEE